jgi:3-mercaptopyruvate sulfurtransferase SseA
VTPTVTVLIPIHHRVSAVVQAAESAAVELVDVRSGPEFTGEILSPPGLPETCQRGVKPGARSITRRKLATTMGRSKRLMSSRRCIERRHHRRQTHHCLLPHRERSVIPGLF